MKLPHFRLLRIDGNQICEEGLKELSSIVANTNVEIPAFEDNDEDGDNDLEELTDLEVDEEGGEGGEEDDK